MTSEHLLTVPEVAGRVRVSEYTVREWLREGHLKGYRPGGTKAGWRIRERDLANFVAGVLAPGIEEYAGYSIWWAHPNTTGDGRFGRSWVHIYQNPDDEERIGAARVIVFHRSPQALERPPHELPWVAMEYAWRWLHTEFDMGQFSPGIFYQIVIGRDGAPQIDSSQFDDATVRE